MRSLQLRILAVFPPSTGNPRCGCTLKTVCCSFSSSSLFYKLALPAEIFRPRLSHGIRNRESNTSWAKPWHGNLELLLKVANIRAKRAYENIITLYVLSMCFLDHSSLSGFLSIVIEFSRNNRVFTDSSLLPHSKFRYSWKHAPVPMEISCIARHFRLEVRGTCVRKRGWKNPLHMELRNLLQLRRKVRSRWIYGFNESLSNRPRWKGEYMRIRYAGSCNFNQLNYRVRLLPVFQLLSSHFKTRCNHLHERTSLASERKIDQRRDFVIAEDKSWFRDATWEITFEILVHGTWLIQSFNFDGIRRSRVVTAKV